MTDKEKSALPKAGLVIVKLNYDDASPVILSPLLLLKHNWREWPSMSTFHEIFHATAQNTTVLTFMGKAVGLSFMATWDENHQRIDTISVSSSHPMAKFWLSILQPIWDEQNKGKCPVCHDTGWDGDGYRLVCWTCGKSKE